ncbi:hypothetical protein GCM10008995_26380 [Halobellus salinus]|uniref:Uncharacterized protein n=1 Tax=Halobellus salinus TaxID=931585 RepID=A0A830EKU1_9EURY|nr:hypothetical protein [Halobellus salinus]GGJ15289.1 hypothetical protein GCM10008995_26380 [Halobellus salinus]
MSTQSRTTLIRAVRRNLNLRIRTLEDLAAGRKNPTDRRASIIEKRRSLISAFGGETSSRTRTNRSPSRSDTETKTEEKNETDQDDSTVTPKDGVNIELESPSDEEIQAANTLAEEHKNADEIALVEKGSIQVKDSSSTTFSVKISEILNGEEDSGPDTVPAASPSMAQAAANKRGSDQVDG